MVPLDLDRFLHTQKGVEGGNRGVAEADRGGLEGDSVDSIGICRCEAALRSLRPGRTSSCSRWLAFTLTPDRNLDIPV